MGHHQADAPNKPRGIPRVDDRCVLNGLFWVLRSGAPLRDLPEAYGPPTPHLHSRHLCRTRNLVERFFNKIKHCRRIATRYDKLAANYLTFVKLASIRVWLRVYECTSQSRPWRKAALSAHGPRRWSRSEAAVHSRCCRSAIMAPRNRAASPPVAAR